MANEYQQKNRCDASKEDLTEIRATETDERIELIGYEDNYEITRLGEIYSKRLKRYIKHKSKDFGESSATYIEFNLDGEKIRMGVGKAVAESWLTPEERQEIANRLPENIMHIENLKRLSLTNELANEFKVSHRAVFYILKNEIERRRKEEGLFC